MDVSVEDLQNLVNQFGAVLAARQAELDMAEDIADSDLTVAQEATTDELNTFKSLVAALIQGGGVEIVQEGDEPKGDTVHVVMPSSIGCDC